LESLALAYVIPATSNKSNADSIAALNRVLGAMLRSFPQYLRWSRPWVPPGHERVLAGLEKIVTEQDTLAERVFDAIDDLGGLPDTGEFPMDFTDTHDLAIDYMLREAVGYSQQDVAALEAVAANKNLAPQAEPLVAEGLNTAKRHLATLAGLVPAQPTV
jgi:bacterioferritin (cytochrome b1)